jgi:hypothetical protein
VYSETYLHQQGELVTEKVMKEGKTETAATVGSCKKEVRKALKTSKGK